MRAPLQVGTVRGEDYDFQFSGRVREGKLQFRLNLEHVGDDSQQEPEVREPEKQRCVLLAVGRSPEQIRLLPALQRDFWDHRMFVTSGCTIAAVRTTSRHLLCRACSLIHLGQVFPS